MEHDGSGCARCDCANTQQDCVELSLEGARRDIREQWAIPVHVRHGKLAAE